jgi:HlyD family secretion protein
MNTRLMPWLVCTALMIRLVAVATAAEPAADPQPDAAAANAEPSAAKPDAEPAKPETPASHTVKRQPLKITLELDGLFQARSTAEISLRFEEYTPSPAPTVQSAVKHGAKVKAGDVLLTLDPEKLDKQIDDLKTELRLAELSLQQAEQNLAVLEKTTPLDLAANERAAKINQEDRKYYFDVQRPFDLKVAEFNLTRARNFLEYSEEELRQLEKMYEADEITEETEAIVLKRARDQLKSAKMSVESSQLSRDFALQFGIPRADESLRASSERRQLELERAQLALPQALQRQQIEIEKLRVQNRRNAERLKRLEADRELLTIRAPLDGLVYYGKETRGKFAEAQPLIESLRPHGTVQVNQVLMTVVQSGAMTIRATVPEAQLHRLRLGLSGVAIPNGFPDLKLPAVLSQWNEIPIGPASFDATFKVGLNKNVTGIVPGMACKVKLTAYAKKNALAVPAQVVKTDDFEEQRYVYLMDKAGKVAKRTVTVGEKTEKLLEITAGLAEGDKVLLEAPKDEK